MIQWCGGTRHSHWKCSVIQCDSTCWHVKQEQSQRYESTSDMRQSVSARCWDALPWKRPVFKILSEADSQENYLCILNRNCHITFAMLPHYLVKFEVTILSTSLSSKTRLWNIEHRRPSNCWNKYAGLHSALPVVASHDLNPTDYAMWGILHTMQVS